MQIVSWNVASVRARLPLVIRLLEEKKPDVLLLQEIKAQESTFPFEPFKNSGYDSVISGQKSFNGVAVLARQPLLNATTTLPGLAADYQEARFIQAQCFGITFMSVYVPNGNPPQNNPADTTRLSNKLIWMSALTTYVKQLLSEKKPFILGGDFNVIENDFDVYDPDVYRENALMLPVVRDSFAQLTKLELTNAVRQFNKESPLYSFWDFQMGAWYKNQGMLLDHLFISPVLSPLLTNAGIDKQMRGLPKPSDHVPVWCTLENPETAEADENFL